MDVLGRGLYAGLLCLMCSTCHAEIVSTIGDVGAFGPADISGGDLIVFSPTIAVPPPAASALATDIVFRAGDGFAIDSIVLTQETLVGVFAGGEILSAMTLDGEAVGLDGTVSPFVDMESETYSVSSALVPESFSISLADLNATSVSLNVQSSLFSQGFASGYLPSVSLKANSVVATAIPEPATFSGILLLGLAGVGLRRGRR